MASASPESDSGGARGLAQDVPGHCPGCTQNLSGKHSALLMPWKSFHSKLCKKRSLGVKNCCGKQRPVHSNI